MLFYGNSSTKFSNVHYLQRIAENLSKAGRSWGCVSAIQANGRTIWIADAYRRDGKRCFVHADEKFGTRIGDFLDLIPSWTRWVR